MRVKVDSTRKRGKVEKGGSALTYQRQAAGQAI